MGCYMARRNLKYKSFKEVVDAYKKGELTEPIYIDNDECFVSIPNVGRVYENHPDWLLRAALELLGVPFENV